MCTRKKSLVSLGVPNMLSEDSMSLVPNILSEDSMSLKSYEILEKCLNRT